MRLRYVGLVGLAIVALGGCASPDSPSAPPPPISTSAVQSSPAVPSAPVSSAPAAVPSLSLAGTVTVTGQVTDGVEPGCVLLKAPDKLYLLIGGDQSKFRSGATLTVVGRPQSNMMSTCQQGVPFQVVSVKEG